MKRMLAAVWETPRVMGAVIAAVVIGMVLALKALGALQFLDLLSYDLLVRGQSPADVKDSRISLVTITESDISAFGEWPLTDLTLAGAIRKLQSMDARVIGVDIYRDMPVPPGEEEFNRELLAADNIIFVKKMGGSDGIEVRPPAVLQDSEQVGFSDVVLDPGGVVRRGLLFLDDGYNVSLSFSLRLALLYLQEHGIFPEADEMQGGAMKLGGVTLPPLEAHHGPYTHADAGGYQLLLDFRQGRLPFESVSLSDLMADRVDANAFRDRIVIVGVAAASVKDVFYTPFSSTVGNREGVPGIVIHAQLASQLLRAALDGQQALRFPGRSLESGWVLLWGVLAAVVGLVVRSFRLYSMVAVAGLVVQAVLFVIAFDHLWWISLVQPALAWLGVSGVVTAYMSSYENSQRKLLMQLFEKHVSSDVAAEIWDKRDQFVTSGRLNSQKLTATVLFSDIEHFTSVSERLEPEELMEWLNTYMEAMANVVIGYGGVIDDYYGDAIKANFGVPLPRSSEEEIRRDAIRAVECGLAMRDRLVDFNRLCVERGLPRLRMRVGICTGSVVAGCLGSSKRMKYTSIGDTVNTAARLESFDKVSFESGLKDNECRVLVSRSTFDYIRDVFETEAVGELSLRGKDRKIEVFRIAGYPEPQQEQQIGEVRI